MNLGMFWQPADGSGPAERLSKPDAAIDHRPEAWSPDGRTLAFLVTTGGGAGLGAGDIWTLSLEADRATKPLVEGLAEPAVHGIFPERPLVRVRLHRSWRHDGNVRPAVSSNWRQVTRYQRTSVARLFGRRMAGNCSTTREAGSWPSRWRPRRPSQRERPWLCRLRRAILLGPGRNFDITPDGKQFIVVMPATTAGDEQGQIAVTLNWFEELRRRVPSN